MLWSRIAGKVNISLVSADVEATLGKINSAGIEMNKIRQIDQLTVQAVISHQDLAILQKIVRQTSAKISVLDRSGLIYTAAKLIRRPVLFFGILTMLILTAYIPSRIFFVTVQGNSKIPSKLILSAAEECGIRFGASRKEVRSEKIKNSLLATVPDLSWAGINTSGCVATIQVKERSADETQDSNTGISSIIAIRDGIIRSCNIRNGSRLCRVGQAVKAGQVLVSGYVDCGIHIKGTRADAEIFGQTEHELTVTTPTDHAIRGQTKEVTTRYSLRLGKKLIKLYKDSGISHVSCVKMITEEPLSLPGGYQLPISLVCETLTEYSSDVSVQTGIDSYSWINEFTEQYLTDQMVAGSILSRDGNITVSDGICIYTGRFSCLEMIGKVRYEEILDNYE